MEKGRKGSRGCPIWHGKKRAELQLLPSKCAGTHTWWIFPKSQIFLFLPIQQGLNDEWQIEIEIRHGICILNAGQILILTSDLFGRGEEVRAKNPKHYSVPTDDAFLHHLELKLQRLLQGRVRNLRLVQHDQGLVLQGHAPTYYAKQLAQHALLAESPLPLVSNDIQVI